MIGGHPFETAALDEQRARQRKRLALLPDRHVQKFAGEALQVDRAKAPLLERQLRAEVDKNDRFTELEPVLKGYERDCEVDAVTAATNALSAFLDDPVAEEIRRAAIDERHQGGTVEVTRAQGEHIASLIRLLVWADDLAQDAYVDPRVDVMRGTPG
jgi:hypothetical protein